MNTSRFFSIAGVAFSMALAACGGAAEEAEELAVEQSELGEIGCATVGGNPYVGDRQHGVSREPATTCGTTFTFSSPNATYTNGATCGDQYIHEFKNIQGRKLQLFPNWDFNSQPIAPGTCENAQVEMATYVRHGVTKQWTTFTTKVNFLSVPGLGCWPLFDTTNHGFPPTLDGTEGYDMIRSATKATYTIPATPRSPAITYKVPVKVDIRYPPSPC